MWLFLSDAFLSIVADFDDPDLLLVRARAKGDIERVFPTATVLATPDHDYAFRAFIPRREVAAVLSRQVQNIRYTNFKNSIRDRVRHGIYFSVYNAALSLSGAARVALSDRRSLFAADLPF